MTVWPRGGACGRERARSLFEALARVLAREGLEPVQGKIYGDRDHRRMAEEERRRAFAQQNLEPDAGWTFHEGRPIENDGLAGIQVWAIGTDRSQGFEVRTVGEGSSRGRLWTAPGVAALYLPGVRGERDGVLVHGVTAQAEAMFANAESALRAHGFSFRHVVRTWIYLGRILDWYAEFNRVRNAFFEARGIGRDGAPLPASTGIQARSGDEECTMDLLAMRIEPAAEGVITPITHTSRQGEARSYGSSFARAMHTRVAGHDTIWVSGTASIGADGRTRHAGDPDAQVAETLLDLGAVLAAGGAGLADVRSATVFCKRPAVFDSFRQALRLLSLPRFPYVAVLADVCRPELEIEIEAVATSPRGVPRRQGG